MIDAYGDTWREIAAQLKEFIEQGRGRLEQNDQSYGETQFIRGRISACREILGLVKAPPLREVAARKVHGLDKSGI